jgi:hypothetical protein
MLHTHAYQVTSVSPEHDALDCVNLRSDSTCVRCADTHPKPGIAYTSKKMPDLRSVLLLGNLMREVPERQGVPLQ